jgi:putative radical SAM enzyme (TIGR03279 family)
VSVQIKTVVRHSYADRAGILDGETLLSINGNEIVDVLDYRFYQLNSVLELKIRNPKGEVRSVRIRKPEYEELGLDFETYLMDREKSCRNKCIFCFIDQLPKGLRETLYFKDDDSRLSFLFGNYVTLTNLTEHEISRIIKMHISPINVSVHTTNPELRVKMMGNRFAGQSLSILKRLSDSSIDINTQIVCCPGINDGDELRRSLNDLYHYNANLIAVVPVGLTKFREGLYPLTPFTQEKAAETVDIIEEFGEMCLRTKGKRIAYAADELYIKAGRDIPDASFYGDFEAIENGIGLIAMLREDLLDELAYTDADDSIRRTVSLACGTSAAPYLRELMDRVEEKFNHVHIHVYPIVNRFFGEMINVSGLIVGSDLIDQLRGKPLGEELLISSSMLRFENDLFLDDVHIDDVKRKLNIPVTPIHNDGVMLLNAILGKEGEDG